MKTPPLLLGQATRAPRHPPKRFLTAALIAVASLSWGAGLGRAQQPGPDAPGTQVLTRGPVHEAFAGVVSFNAAPGVVVTKAPPEIIVELPPEQKPEGDGVTWIPGYWGWDDERSDFLWVSGTWRTLPPGRAWMAGYWGKSAQGYQWTCGYWADEAVRETSYLPPPPETLEVGANIAAPSVDYGWSPGCWIWGQGRYAWRPGYWAQGRADWDWCPDHYVWTPRGYIFVGGFWDYPVERRGLLFAPVYLEAGVYAHRGYIYSPTIVIDLGVFTDHLFLRPSYQHYYFGDYYASSYSQGGFYASFTFQTGHYGYDPIYSQQRWEHRQDRNWEHTVATSYEYRRDHESARPPRTWAAQRSIDPATVASKQNHVVVASSLDQLAQRKDSSTRFQPVAKAEREKLSQRGTEVQTSRDQRRTQEAKTVETAVPKPGEVIEPAKIATPRSPIVARPANQLAKNQTPPAAPQAPQIEAKAQPKAAAPGRPPGLSKGSPSPEAQPPASEKEKKPAPERTEAPAPVKQTPTETPQRAQQPGKETPAESPPKAKETSKQTPPDPEQVPKEAAAVKPRNPQPTPRKSETKAPTHPDQPVAVAAAKAPAAPPATDKGPEKKATRVAETPSQRRPDANEKGAAKLMRRDPPKEAKGKPAPPAEPLSSPGK